MKQSRDSRNVLDIYKGWSEEEIQQNLRTYPLLVCMMQLTGDFNIGTVVRNANAFGAQSVFYIGNKKWDRRGAVGTYHYTNVRHYPTWDQFYAYSKGFGFSIVGLEITEDAIDIREFTWPEKTAIVLGEENLGLSDTVLEQCDYVVKIPQFGSVRSLNAGVASGIAMFTYISQRK
jgi:tRNA G18 (ribose-2'-O)-methylase SpoU